MAARTLTCHKLDIDREGINEVVSGSIPSQIFPDLTRTLSSLKDNVKLVP